MKILIMHELFPPEVSGGGEMLMFRLAKGLQKKGHDITVLTSGDPKIKEYEGVKTVRIPVNRYATNLALPIALKYAKDADVIQSCTGNMTFPAYLAAKILKKPICHLVLLNLGSSWKDTRGNLAGSLFMKLERFYNSRKFDTVVVMNNMMRSAMREATGARTVLLQPGIDHEKFRKYRKIRRENIALFVGNFAMKGVMAKLKGLPYLIEAARKLPDVKFVVVGEGSAIDEMKKTSPLNVEFMGKVVGNQLVKLYSKSLVFCLPSMSESFSFVTAEAMAAGCAVVSTIDLGQAGRTIRPMDSDEIAEAVRLYVARPEIALRDGMKNRRTAEKLFRWERLVDGFEKIYKELLSP